MPNPTSPETLINPADTIYSIPDHKRFGPNENDGLLRLDSLQGATRARPADIQALSLIANDLMPLSSHEPDPLRPSSGPAGPAFFITEDIARGLMRRPISPLPAKPYRGYHRLTQALRHVALVANTTMKSRMGADPLEVQASTVGGILHIASNFHSDKILGALNLAMNDTARNSTATEYVTGHQRRSWDDVIRARHVRHLRKLQSLCSNEHMLAKTTLKATTEIRASTTYRDGLTPDSVERQCGRGLKTVYLALRDIRACATSPHVRVHTPRYPASGGALSTTARSATMHAELTIENYLAENETALYSDAVRAAGLADGDPIIVPMAGRFVPCAVCKEVEHVAMRSGIFALGRRRFVLWRASKRIGMAFPNEVQHFPMHALAPGNSAQASMLAAQIRDRFIQDQQSLQSYDQPVVRVYSLDTDSEASATE